MEIERITVDEIQAKRESEGRGGRFDIRFNIKSIEKEGESATITYNYTVGYEDGSKIEVAGKIYGKGGDLDTDPDKIPPEKIEPIVNAINYVGTTQAVILARALGLTPPLRLPILRYAKKKE